MKKLDKKQILIIILMTLCCASFLYLVITNIRSLVDVCNHIRNYEHLLVEPDLVVDLTEENILSTISQLKLSIVKIIFSIISFTILFVVSQFLLITTFRKSSVKDRINPPAT